MPPEVPLLRVTNLRARYGRAEVLHEVSFSVAANETVALMGSNGAGKTTLLRAVTGAVMTTGRVEFDGRDITRMPTHEIAKLGIAHVPQGRGTFAEMTVDENVRLGTNVASPAARRSTLDDAYALFPDLAQRRAQRAGTLSGGEQQMLAIARALAGRPRLLLLDEPSLGLAPLVVRRIFAALRTIVAAGTVAVLVVEQNVALALSFAARGLILDAGALTLQGPAAELRDLDAVRAAYLGV
jgi:branched-chain amino acid transport system ATP-binding protein